MELLNRETPFAPTRQTRKWINTIYTDNYPSLWRNQGRCKDNLKSIELRSRAVYCSAYRRSRSLSPTHSYVEFRRAQAGLSAKPYVDVVGRRLARRRRQARSAGDKTSTSSAASTPTLRNILIDTYRIVRTSSIISHANSETLMNYTGSFCTDMQFVSTVLKAKGNFSQTSSDDLFWLICSLFVWSNHTSNADMFCNRLLFGLWTNLDFFVVICFFPLLENLKQLNISTVYLLWWTQQ